jgi:hypothetical protein
MKSATVHELKNELLHLNQKQLVDICLRLTKFKKENKELLTYVLFEAGDEQAYINKVKDYIDAEFSIIDNKTNFFILKKIIRKILRVTKTQLKYSGSKSVEIELLLHFCESIKKWKIPVAKHPVLQNIYDNQLKKVTKTLATLHEDLQYDYSQKLAGLIV